MAELLTRENVKGGSTTTPNPVVLPATRGGMTEGTFQRDSDGSQRAIDLLGPCSPETALVVPRQFTSVCHHQ